MALTTVLFAGHLSHAINVNAIYTAACKREIGVVIRADRNRVKFLTIEGKVIDLPPYEVIYLANYPMDRFPLHGPTQLKGTDHYRVTTRIDRDLVTLVEGWPIGFTEEKISFLTTRGAETVIDRSSIWGVDLVATNNTPVFKNGQEPFDFVHPQSFRDCPSDNPKGQKIYPQQILSEPVVIKREVDQLREGYERLEWYRHEQKFYPLPMVYQNKTSLGVWQNLGSRYGSKGKRSNNLTPFLVDEYSSDIFDYQHLIVTGSAPMPFAIHEESQTQFYYRFKASYFHFSVMVDPSLVLVGRNYKWQAGDFEGADDRLNDVAIVELGFDYGPFALHLYAGNSIQIGLSTGSDFEEATINVPRIGFSYTHHLFGIEFSGGSGSKNDSTNQGSSSTDLSMFRLNATANLSDHWSGLYSLIQRKLDHKSSFTYSSQSLTNYFQLSYAISRRLSTGGYVSLERHTLDAQASTSAPSTSPLSNEKLYTKGGAYISLSF